MPRLPILFVLSVTTALLAGCATVAVEAGGAAQPSPSPTPSLTTAKVDAAAAAKADLWLEGAVLPPDAIPSESVPETAPPFGYSYYDWPCPPMEERTAYWTIAGANVVDTANWLKEHPTAGLMDPAPVPLSGGPDIDSVTLGNVPEQDSLEGIAFTVNRTPDGVAVRAEIGVFTDSSVCRSLPPNSQWGGPGQG